MHKTDSVFHHLQREGAKALSVANVKTAEFEVVPKPFIEKISNGWSDPFPIYLIQQETAQRISDRFTQIFAAQGLVLSPGMDDGDWRASWDLVLEELCATRLPARRFGLEMHGEKEGRLSLVFEAMKNPILPYRAAEFGEKKIADCDSFRIHVVTPSQDTFLRQDHPFVLHNDSFNFSIPQFLGNVEGKAVRFEDRLVITHYPVCDDALRVSIRGPSQAKMIDASSIFLQAPEKNLQNTGAVIERTYIAFQLLWALEREPKLFLRNTEEFQKENVLRKRRGLSTYSPIERVNIDHEELCRVESHRAAEIANALATHGRYSIEGLVCVRGYDVNDGQGGVKRHVEDYARCKKEVVRTTANKLLHDKDYEGLAKLMRAHGNETSKARYQLSAAKVPVLV